MMKKILLVLLLLGLTACQTSSAGNPWAQPAYNSQAAGAPSALTRGAAQDGNAVYTPYQAPNEQAMTPGAAQPGMQQAQNNDFATTIGGSAMNSGAPETSYSAAPIPIPRAMQDLPPVKVGLLLPLSGKQAELGQAMLQAAQLALFDMGYKSFELMPRDTKASPQAAAQAAQSAINDGAQLILGPLFAEEVRTVKPVAARANVNVIAFSTDWSLAGDNTFIMGFLPFAQINRVIGYAASQGYRKIGILASDTEYGNAVVAAYNAAAYRNGMGAPTIARYKPGSDDTTNVVRSFTRYDERFQYFAARRQPYEERLKANPRDTEARQALVQLDKEAMTHVPFQAVLLPVGGEDAREIANLLNFYELGPDVLKRLGTGLWDDQALATESALRGAWFAAPSPKLRRDFEIRYRDLYGSAAPRLSTLAYDATALAAVLAKKGFQETGHPAYQRSDFINPNGFAGIDGIFRFRPDGLIERGLAVLEYDNSSIRVIDQPPSTFQSMDY